MGTFRVATLTSVLLCGLVGSALAQGRSKNADITEALTDIFGANTAFTADAHVSMKSASDVETLSMEMSFAVLNGKIRTETDMTKVKSGQVPPEAIARMKQMGMDRTVHLYLAEKHLSYLIYPGLKSYCEIPTQSGGDAATNAPPKIDRADIGKETIDGHPCIKTQVTVTPADGKPTKALIWRATDLNNYPVQVSLALDENSVVTTTFHDINQAKPDAALFEPPADYTKYNSIQEMMRASMQRMMGAVGE